MVLTIPYDRSRESESAFNEDATQGSPDQPPVITSVAPTQAAAGRPFAYQVTATDADGDLLTYLLTQAPAGMNMEEIEHVYRFRIAQSVRPGAVVLNDFNFENPKLDLEAEALAALEEARTMPPGPERNEAMKQAGILRNAADLQGLFFAKRGRPAKP